MKDLRPDWLIRMPFQLIKFCNQLTEEINETLQSFHHHLLSLYHPSIEERFLSPPRPPPILALWAQGAWPTKRPRADVVWEGGYVHQSQLDDWYS